MRHHRHHVLDDDDDLWNPGQKRPHPIPQQTNPSIEDSNLRPVLGSCSDEDASIIPVTGVVCLALFLLVAVARSYSPKRQSKSRWGYLEKTDRDALERALEGNGAQGDVEVLESLLDGNTGYSLSQDEQGQLLSTLQDLRSAELEERIFTFLDREEQMRAGERGQVMILPHDDGGERVYEVCPELSGSSLPSLITEAEAAVAAGASSLLQALSRLTDAKQELADEINECRNCWDLDRLVHLRAKLQVLGLGQEMQEVVRKRGLELQRKRAEIKARLRKAAQAHHDNGDVEMLEEALCEAKVYECCDLDEYHLALEEMKRLYSEEDDRSAQHALEAVKLIGDGNGGRATEQEPGDGEERLLDEKEGPTGGKWALSNEETLERALLRLQNLSLKDANDDLGSGSRHRQRQLASSMVLQERGAALRRQEARKARREKMLDRITKKAQEKARQRHLALQFSTYFERQQSLEKEKLTRKEALALRRREEHRMEVWEGKRDAAVSADEAFAWRMAWQSLLLGAAVVVLVTWKRLEWYDLVDAATHALLGHCYILSEEAPPSSPSWTSWVLSSVLGMQGGSTSEIACKAGVLLRVLLGLGGLSLLRHMGTAATNALTYFLVVSFLWWMKGLLRLNLAWLVAAFTAPLITGGLLWCLDANPVRWELCGRNARPAVRHMLLPAAYMAYACYCGLRVVCLEAKDCLPEFLSFVVFLLSR